MSTSKFDQTAWHMAAGEGDVELLEKLWDWAKELQVKPEDLRNKFWLSSVKNGQTGWHMFARKSNVEILKTLSDWAK